jgi:hypothetical protein
MTGFQLVHAAVRLRKPVLVVDLTSDPGLPRRLAAVCAAYGAPLRVFCGAPPPWELRAGPAPGFQPACYEPFRYGDPARRTSLVAAMLSWEGPGQRYRRSCVAYLEDIFELLDAAPGDPRVPVLDEIITLLDPAAMRARLDRVPAAYPRREVLAERIRVSVSLVGAEPASTARLAAALGELRSSAFGRWLRPPGTASGRPGGGRGVVPPGASAAYPEIDLGRAVAERAVVLFRLGAAGHAAGPSAMLGRLVCQDLLAARSEGGGLVWLTECGLLPRPDVAEMIARGAGTGLPVLAGTTSPQVAADLADLVNAVIAYPADDPGLAAKLDADAGGLYPPRDGEFLLAVKEPRRVVPRGRPVPARVPQHPRDIQHAAPREDA